MNYFPQMNGQNLNDPISEHADNLLGEWAWNNRHRAAIEGTSIYCQCGYSAADDDDLREHWRTERQHQRYGADVI